MERRVVVTGLGVVSPVGNNIDEMWASIKAGKHGIAPITVGVTYACCLAPCLPYQTHDVPVRYVLSEGRLAPAHAKRDDFAR